MIVALLRKHELIRLKKGNESRLKRLAERFLRFAVSVALTLVEGVSAVADDVGTDGHALAFFVSCPNFCGIEKFCAGAEAAVVLRNDEAIYFGATRHFEKRRDTDVDPADDRFFKFSHKDSVPAGRLDLTKTLPHFLHRGGVAELAA